MADLSTVVAVATTATLIKATSQGAKGIILENIGGANDIFISFSDSTPALDSGTKLATGDQLVLGAEWAHREIYGIARTGATNLIVEVIQ